MSAMYFPLAALMIDILLFIMFFSKKSVKNKETKIYSLMIIVNFIECLLDVVGITYIRHSGNINIFAMLQKVDILMIILYASLLFKYVYNVAFESRNNKFITIPAFIFTIIVIISTLFLPCIPVVNNSTIDSAGLSPEVAVISIIVYIAGILISIVVSIIRNIKNIRNKKYYPLYSLILLGCFGVLLRHYFPELVIEPFIMMYVLLIMYHTIENPDLKMIRELQVAREQADKANKAKTDFLSSMSHEIRTPLNAIVGFSECIIDDTTLEDAKTNAKDIVNASQTLLEIVNGILDISKIEAGKIEIVNSKYNAIETFEELAKLITPKMNEKGLDFTYSIAPDIPNTLFGDHANLKKIITNLLSNASKYTDKGFVRYEVNCVNSGDVCRLIISVEDSGRGIKKESIDKMFTKFQRLDEDKNSTIEGTGLGLAITKQLIELMGGKIIVHTIYGSGSKFTVVLNQKIEKADETTTKKIKTTLDLTDVKILLVDDTALNLKVASKLLQKYNANYIETGSSGFECIDRIQRGEKYDLILLDDMMPKMTGVETLQKLKQIPGFDIPTIALTANAITGMREKYLKDGFNDYLAKPIERDQLIRVVNQVLGRNITEDIPMIERSESNEATKTINEPENKKNQTNEEVPEVIPVSENVEEELGTKIDLTERDNNNNIDFENVASKTPFVGEPVRVINSFQTLVKKQDDIEELNLDENNNNEVINANNQVDDNLYDRTFLEKNGVDINHGLELLGDMEMYNMTMNDFMAEVDSKWNNIINYKNNSDMKNYSIEVHSLKSDCKYLGFMTLAEIAYQHELKSKDNDLEFVNNNFNQLENEYNKVHEIAKTYVEHNKTEE